VLLWSWSYWWWVTRCEKSAEYDALSYIFWVTVPILRSLLQIVKGLIFWQFLAGSHGLLATEYHQIIFWSLYLMNTCSSYTNCLQVVWRGSQMSIGANILLIQCLRYVSVHQDFSGQNSNHQRFWCVTLPLSCHTESVFLLCSLFELSKLNDYWYYELYHICYKPPKHSLLHCTVLSTILRSVLLYNVDWELQQIDSIKSIHSCSNFILLLLVKLSWLIISSSWSYVSVK